MRQRIRLGLSSVDVGEAIKDRMLHLSPIASLAGGRAPAGPVR